MKGFLSSKQGAAAISGNDTRKPDPSSGSTTTKKLDEGLELDEKKVGGDDAEYFTEMIGELNEMVQQDPEKFQELKENLRQRCEANDALPEKFLDEKGEEANPEEAG